MYANGQKYEGQHLVVEGKFLGHGRGQLSDLEKLSQGLWYNG